MYYPILYWLLASLIVFFTLIQIERFGNNIPEDLNSDIWVLLLLLSALWPLGVLIILVGSFSILGDFLTKERGKNADQ